VLSIRHLRQAQNRYQQPHKILLTLIAGDLAQYHSARADFISKYKASKATVYSILKGKLSRRFLQIPNPKHFSILSEKIVSRWTVWCLNQPLVVSNQVLW